MPSSIDRGAASAAFVLALAATLAWSGAATAQTSSVEGAPSSRLATESSQHAVPGYAAATRETPFADDAAVSARIAYIQSLLDAEQGEASRWWRTWTATYAGLAVAQGAGATLFENDGRRAALAMGAMSSSLGLFTLVAVPFPVATAGDQLRAVTAGTPAERIRKLLFAEKLYRVSARSEAFRATPWPHFIALALTGGASLTLWLHFDAPGSAAIQLLGGMALAEAQILTQPRGVIEAWRREGRQLSYGSPAPASRRARIEWTVRPYHRGLVVGGRF